MTDCLLASYARYYGSLGLPLLPRNSLVHPAFKTSFVLSAGVIDMQEQLAGKADGTPRCLLIQPCFRHFDIDNIETDRHLSLFLMGAALYFDKPSAQSVVQSLLRFLLETLSLDPNGLWLTTFAGGGVSGHAIPADTESTAAWSAMGLSPKRVLRCGPDENFWHEGAGSGETRSGLCGPHTEIFVDRGRPICGSHGCIPGCGCGRFLEIANIVFPRYRLGPARLETIPSLLAEAALGLDRVAMTLESVPTIFDISSMRQFKHDALRGPLVGVSNVRASLAVLDHVRSFCCLVAEGAVPSRRGRGHILRRLLRDSMNAAAQVSSSPRQTVTAIAELLLEHPEACCEVDVSSNWSRVSGILEQELRLHALRGRTDLER